MSRNATGALAGRRPDRIFTDLAAGQADGLACVACGTDYLTAPVPHVPVGWSRTGSQVFACDGGCMHSETG